MFISVSKHQDSFRGEQKYFQTVRVETTRDLVRIMSERAWSPIIWREGIRHGTRFLHAQLIAIDFDEGETIAKIEAKLQEKDLSYILGTTRHHQKPKDKKPACDRFRVILFAEKPITNADDYKYTLWRYLKDLFPNADKQCRDLARFFYPCAPHSYEEIGENADVFVQPESFKLTKLRWQNLDVKMGRALLLPPRVKKLLQDPVPEGRRNLTSFKIGLELGRLGIPLEKAVAKTALVVKGLSDEELERAVANGWNHGRQLREEFEELRRRELENQ